jgi:lysophospholipase L1-like esterase
MAGSGSSEASRALGNLAALALGLALTLGLFESGLRIYGFNPFGHILDAPSPEQAAFLRPSDHENLDYELVPGASGFIWGADVEINAEGLRDRDITIEKPPGTRRIAVIGDSVTFGNLLPLVDTYPKQLERRLRDRGEPVEVLNFGVGGYDTLQEVALFEHNALRFDPDGVVVGYSANDLSNFSPNLQYIRRLTNYASPIYRLRVAQFIAVWRDRLLLARAAAAANTEEAYREANRERIADLSGDAVLAKRRARLESYLEAHPKAAAHPILGMYASSARIGKLRFALERLAALAGEREVPVVVVIVPSLAAPKFEPGFRLAYDIAEHEASRLGFEVLRLDDAFLEVGLSNLRVIPSDPHPNREGHRMIAEALTDVLAEPPPRSRDR